MYVKQQIAYAVLAALTLAAPAGAEPMRPARSAAPGVLPPYEIVTIIRSTGLDPLGRPMRRGANYVLYAVGNDDREVRVLVNARSGKILSVTPVATAARMPPELVEEPYGPSRYIPPESPEVYEAEPPVVYEGEPPAIYAPRPAAEVPMAPPPGRYAAPPDRADAPPVSEPRVITAIEPGRAGLLLPPPPERFPQRVPPAAAAKPKPAKRAVAALPKQPPLPKPRPGNSAGVAPSAPKSESKSESKPEGRPAVELLPN